ncbi:MAG: uracil phosphoribosyltransferase [Christiangramia sp.]
MKDFFEGIAWLFENILFYPLDALRYLQMDSWALANVINWIFVIIGILAFGYWMKQLKIFHDEDKRNDRTKPKPFLG